MNKCERAIQIAERMARTAPAINDPPPVHKVPLFVWYRRKIVRKRKRK